MMLNNLQILNKKYTHYNKKKLLLKFYLHISHYKVFHYIESVIGVDLVVTLFLSHSCKHFICKNLTDPVHEQGAINGLSSVTVSSKQILHVFGFNVREELNFSSLFIFSLPLT